jgi:hypothetical protein
MQVSKILDVKKLKSVFVAENNRLIDGNWVSEDYSRKEKNQVKEYLINQQYSAELGLDHGNFGNTIAACRNTDNSIVKVINVSYLKGGFAKSVSFIGQVETCHHHLQIGGESKILYILDQHYTQVSKPFVKIFQEVYGEISNIKVADINIDKNNGSLINAVNIEAFRYASQWVYYGDSTPDIQWEKAIEAFPNL